MIGPRCRWPAKQNDVSAHGSECLISLVQIRDNTGLFLSIQRYLRKSPCVCLIAIWPLSRPNPIPLSLEMVTSSVPWCPVSNILIFGRMFIVIATYSKDKSYMAKSYILKINHISSFFPPSCQWFVGNYHSWSLKNPTAGHFNLQ